MYEHEYQGIKQSLSRLAQIEASAQKSLDEHFEKVEREMYHSAKSFVEAFEARQQAAQHRYQGREAMESLECAHEREQEEDDEC